MKYGGGGQHRTHWKDLHCKTNNLSTQVTSERKDYFLNGVGGIQSDIFKKIKVGGKMEKSSLLNNIN